MKNLNLFLIIIGIGLLIGVTIFYLNLKNIEARFIAAIAQFEIPSKKEKSSSLDNFAKCLSEKGVKFYGAILDSKTQNQKNIFGESFKYLTYIECVEPQTKQMTFECQVAEIKTFPTWESLDGKRITGKVSLEKLSEWSSCSL